MLRIHFAETDLARVRLLKGPDPLWELMLSGHVLQNRFGPPVFDEWRRCVRPLLRDPDLVSAIRFLNVINPDGCAYLPDFLTPEPQELGTTAAIETVLATPRSRLGAELRELSRYRALPSWVRQLAEGEKEMLTRLGSSLRTYHRAVVFPHFGRIRQEVEADRAGRARSLIDRGVEGFLDSLRPILRWEYPVLHGDYPVERDLYLNGRGLIFVPSFFCWRRPVTLANPQLTPVLVYPIAHSDGVVRDERALARLLGRSRAGVLEAVGTGATTGELARMTRLSATSASEHASVLRGAGLISSRREANTVLHTLTPLGAKLLAGG